MLLSPGSVPSHHDKEVSRARAYEENDASAAGQKREVKRWLGGIGGASEKDRTSDLLITNQRT